MMGATTLRAVDYLLIGGGLASATAAKAIRQRDPHGSIVMVTNDPELPYHRPPLSKEYLRGEISAEGVYGKGGVYVHRRPWYDEQRVEVLRGVEAQRLDTSAQRARLADGRTYRYGMLLLATGGHPRRLSVPGMDLRGVHVLRTLADSNTLRALFNEPGKRVVAVGSGFIGMETAAGAMMKGSRVTIVDPQRRVWSRVVPPRISEYLQDQFTRRGASLRLGSTVTGFTEHASGHLAGVRIAPVGGKGPTEEIPCDVAIVGVGIQLNTDMAASAGLEVDPRHGVVVDERLETRVAGVFAAGDVAAYPDPVAGRMHFEHWDHAIQSGQVAAANMAGGDEPYRHVPYFFSDQLDYSINMLGYPSSNAEVVIRGEVSANTFSAFYLEDGNLRAAFMLNDDAHMDLLRRWIATPIRLTDTQRLADPDVPLAALAPESLR